MTLGEVSIFITVYTIIDKLKASKNQLMGILCIQYYVLHKTTSEIFVLKSSRLVYEYATSTFMLLLNSKVNPGIDSGM